MNKAVIDVIIPAFNEEASIGLVLGDIPWAVVREVLVCDNGSTDRTAEEAAKGGATVLEENRKGYGSACLKGLEYLSRKPASEKPDIVVFLDGDYSDFPEELPSLVKPLLAENYDLAVGSRTLGRRQRGALMPQQIFGNWLATTLIRLFYNYHFTDLGPFRAIRYDKLLALNMKDRNYGWTVEMQVKAAKNKYRCIEVPVRYRKRVGLSKVSGTARGTILAGYKILWTIFKLLYRA